VISLTEVIVLISHFLTQTILKDRNIDEFNMTVLFFIFSWSLFGCFCLTISILYAFYSILKNAKKLMDEENAEDEENEHQTRERYVEFNHDKDSNSSPMNSHQSL